MFAPEVFYKTINISCIDLHSEYLIIVDNYCTYFVLRTRFKNISYLGELIDNALEIGDVTR